jgi:hypothetical protein
MLVSLTVGKVDAGVAVLLTEDKRLVSMQHSLPIPTLPSIIPERIIVYKQNETFWTRDDGMLITVLS